MLPTALCLTLALSCPTTVAGHNVATTPYAASSTSPPYGTRLPWSAYESRLLAAYDVRGGGAGHGDHPCAAAVERCDGTIEVPLDWSNPTGQRIAVAFAWLPRTDRSRPATGTVMANPGGPAEALSSVPLFDQALGPVRERQNLLVVDPRGLGKSTPLKCPDLDLGKVATIGQCADYLGSRIQYFTGDQSAHDLNAVRQALGVPKVSFYGNSYGTAYAQAFVTRYPQYVGAVFLDSVVYTGPDGYGTGWGFESPIRNGMRALDEVCEPSPRCRALPRGAADRWTELVHLLRKRPDPRIPWLQLLQINGFSSDAVLGRETNAAAAAYMRGDRAPLYRLVDGLLTAFPPDEGELKFPELAGTLAYVCADATFPFDRAAPTSVRRQQLDAFYAAGGLEPFSAADVVGSLGAGGWNEWCVHWPAPRPSPLVPPDAVYPDVPVLVVDGQLDTTTPPVGGAAVAARFPRATVVEVPFGDHASAFGLWGPYSECVRDMMRRFLSTFEAVDPGCSAENYRALGRFPRSIRDVKPAAGPGPVHGSDRRLVAAAFATAVDAVARRNPYADLMAGLTEEPGLRGGRIRFDDQAGKVMLTGVRYVADLTVTGHIAITAGRATADLTVSGRHLRLIWQPFRAENSTVVTGTLDGRPLLVRVSAT